MLQKRIQQLRHLAAQAFAVTRGSGKLRRVRGGTPRATSQQQSDDRPVLHVIPPRCARSCAGRRFSVRPFGADGLGLAFGTAACHEPGDELSAVLATRMPANAQNAGPSRATKTMRWTSMKIHRTLMIGLLAAATVSVAEMNTSVQAAGGDEKIKLNGCLVKAEGDDGYLITNLPGEPASSTADRNVATSAIGTSGAFSTVFYWLRNDDDLKEHVGHRVEIEGELKGDIKEGEIKLDRKDNWTELEVKSGGDEMKAKVPNAYIFPDPTRDKDRKISTLVRKVDVDQVKMLSANCE